MKKNDSKHVEDCATEQEPKLEYKKKVVTKKKTARPRMPLRSIPPRTTMRDKTGGCRGSIMDLPAKLLEIQKRLQYVAQEVEKARERGECVTPKIETGGNLNIGGHELNLNDISKSLKSSEGVPGLEKMLNIGGLGGLLKNILGDLDIEKLKNAVEKYSKSSGYEESSKKPVIETNIKISQLDQNPKEWTGLSGAGTIADRNKGSGTTGLKYQKNNNQSYYKNAPESSGSIGRINQRDLGTGSRGQKIEKTARKIPATTQPKEVFKLDNIIEKEFNYEILPKGDKNYEIIVNDLGIEKVNTITYDQSENVLVVNERLKIPLKEYKGKNILGWEYRNDVLTINLEK